MKENETKGPFEVNLFPLKSMVMFPGSNLPLNIFEERYKAMVNDCLKNNRLLAMAPSELLENSENLCVGFGELKLLGKRKDGTMIVLLQGRGLARIEKVTQKEPFMKAEVTELDRDMALSVQGNLGLTRIKIFLNTVMDNRLSHMEDHYADDIEEYQNSMSGAKMVDAAIELLVPNVEQKQMLLEMKELDDQVAFLESLLQAGGPSTQGQLLAQS